MLARPTEVVQRECPIGHERLQAPFAAKADGLVRPRIYGVEATSFVAGDGAMGLAVEPSGTAVLDLCAFTLA